MKFLPHLLTLAGVAIGLGAASSSWWTLVLTTGSTLPVTGWDASAASSSLAVLALVAYGARWTFQGVVRRILAAIQVLASGGAVVAIISSASAPVESALSEITAATGVSGNAARELVESVSVSGSHFLAIGALGLIILGGIVALGEPRTSPGASRYERRARSASLEDSVATWDDLSEGIDPTKR